MNTSPDGTVARHGHPRRPALGAALGGRQVDWPSWPYDHWATLHARYEQRSA
jgi:hypothetical protein